MTTTPHPRHSRRGLSPLHRQVFYYKSHYPYARMACLLQTPPLPPLVTYVPVVPLSPYAMMYSAKTPPLGSPYFTPYFTPYLHYGYS